MVHKRNSGSGGLTAPQFNLLEQQRGGGIDRRDFLRFASVLGLSATLGASPFGPFSRRAAATERGAPGGTIRVALTTPVAAINPLTSTGNGSINLLIQVGEYLCYTSSDLTLTPGLAESWSPNEDGSKWTFKLRKNVKFNDGAPFNAKCVVESINRLADPANGSNSLGAFKGTLSKGAAREVDEYTVEFTLDAPNGNFPYVVSSDTYNSLILPEGYKGDFEKTFVGTGPFKLESYTTDVGAVFVRNEDYWGPKALPDRLEITFYPELQAQIIALMADQVDVIDQVPVTGSQGLNGNPNIEIMRQRSTAHHQLHMKCDEGPFKDKRVRQALALTLDRKRLVDGLIKGTGEIGNDSVFAPVYPSTDNSVPQRLPDIEKAKQLMKDAGVADGFSVDLTTFRYIEIADYAVVIQNFARQIGININVNIIPEGTYYGNVQRGTSPWLDSTLGLTGFGPRSVPNELLQATLSSNGAWNAAAFKNADYDKLLAEYIKAVDLKSQKELAGKIQNMMLDETPVIIGYFYDFLVPMKKGLKGIPSTPNRLFLFDAHFA